MDPSIHTLDKEEEKNVFCHLYFFQNEVENIDPILYINNDDDDIDDPKFQTLITTHS